MAYIFFDLDGTLTDPALGITNSILYALDKMGFPPEPRESLYRFIGPPLIPAFREFLGMTEAEAETALLRYREYFSTVGLFENEPYPGIADELGSLREAGHTLAVATSKPEPFARRILEHFSLDGYFAGVFGATLDETRTAKAEVLRYAVEQLGGDGILASSVMVGDRRHDIEGAKTVGMRSLGVLWGYGSREELTESGADRIVGEVSRLCAVLGEMLS